MQACLICTPDQASIAKRICRKSPKNSMTFSKYLSAWGQVSHFVVDCDNAVVRTHYPLVRNDKSAFRMSVAHLLLAGILQASESRYRTGILKVDWAGLPPRRSCVSTSNVATATIFSFCKSRKSWIALETKVSFVPPGAINRDRLDGDKEKGGEEEPDGMGLDEGEEVGV